MKDIQNSLELDHHYSVIGDAYLPSTFAVTDLATASFGAVGCALASLIETMGLAKCPAVVVDRRLASLWFGFSIFPIGWELPPIWDAIAGDYQTADGWIKLHTNLPHHRAAALSVVGTSAERTKVAKAISGWEKDQLEAEIVAAGGVAAAMRTRSEWANHPHGIAVAKEPLITWGEARQVPQKSWHPTRERPLAGLRVLDLTRVLAGPVATRTLAGFGANVLRIDPPGWDEAIVVPEITLGKRCAFLDLKKESDRAVFEELLAGADVLVHGYRPDALENLGYSESRRRSIAPELIEVCLDAYGWTGPWRGRRGFDSLVQMSCGIADAGMQWASQKTITNKPTPLPVQALDFATGYIMAATVLRALDNMLQGKGTKNAKLSLARTAELLKAHKQDRPEAAMITATKNDFAPNLEQTPWGKANRLCPAATITGTTMKWDSSACEFGSARAKW